MKMREGNEQEEEQEEEKERVKPVLAKRRIYIMIENRRKLTVIKT